MCSGLSDWVSGWVSVRLEGFGDVLIQFGLFVFVYSRFSFSGLDGQRIVSWASLGFGSGKRDVESVRMSLVIGLQD